VACNIGNITQFEINETSKLKHKPLSINNPKKNSRTPWIQSECRTDRAWTVEGGKD